MSVGGSGMGSMAEEYSDLEHQVIRQKVTLPPGADESLTPGDNGAEFDPGERELDREEVAQLVAYRRYGSINMDPVEGSQINTIDRATVDASVGINGDLFREVTTQQNINSNIDVDSGGEIGLLDNYELTALPTQKDSGDGVGAGGHIETVEHTIDFYDWPTSGPVVDSFDTITCGFGAGNRGEESEANFELRYDFWWDVVETGETTSPFGRP